MISVSGVRKSYVVMLFESVYYIGYYTNGKQYV